jgi:hypothetical protein
MKTKKPRIGEDYKTVYEQALCDSKSCLVDMFLKSKNKKTKHTTNYDFFEKVSTDLKLFNTWIEYTYAIIKQKYSYANKKHFYKYIQEIFCKQ